jgi:hypothetical protein
LVFQVLGHRLGGCAVEVALDDAQGQVDPGG